MTLDLVEPEASSDEEDKKGFEARKEKYDVEEAIIDGKILRRKAKDVKKTEEQLAKEKAERKRFAHRGFKAHTAIVKKYVSSAHPKLCPLAL